MILESRYCIAVTLQGGIMYYFTGVNELSSVPEFDYDIENAKIYTSIVSAINDKNLIKKNTKYYKYVHIRQLLKE